MKKYILIITTLIAVSTLTLYAQQAKLEEVAPAAFFTKLKESGKVEIKHEAKDNSLVLLPNCEYSSKIKEGQLTKGEKQVPFNAEFLYIVPKNEGDDSKVKGVKGTIDDISRLFRSPSKMKGMKYHFEKKKPETLYKDVFAIKDLTTPTPIADPVDEEPNGLVAYCMQDDNTYGKLKFKTSYFQNTNTIYALFHLMSPMSVIGVKAVEAENMKINIIAIECEDCFLLYLSADVAAKKIGLINVRKQIDESMSVRIEAIYRWFLEKL